MAEDAAPRARYGEAFWRAHQEAWKRSNLNQREYCEAQGISLKAFGNWWAMNSPLNVHAPPKRACTCSSS